MTMRAVTAGAVRYGIEASGSASNERRRRRGAAGALSSAHISTGWKGPAKMVVWYERTVYDDVSGMDFRSGASGTLTRFEGYSIQERCVAWANSHYPAMYYFSFSLRYLTTNSKPSLLFFADTYGEGVVVSVGVRVPEVQTDPTAEMVLSVLMMRRALRATAELLSIEGDPPEIELTKEEQAWSTNHPPPRFRWSPMTLMFSDARLPERPPPGYRDFDAWSLFPGLQSATPLRSLRRELRKVPKDWRPDAVASLRTLMGEWLERRSVITGSEIISDLDIAMAAWAMSRGKQFYESTTTLPAPELEEVMERDGWDEGLATELAEFIEEWDPYH